MNGDKLALGVVAAIAAAGLASRKGSSASPQTHAMKLPAWTLRLKRGTKALDDAIRKGDRRAMFEGVEDTSFWTGRVVCDAFGSRDSATEKELEKAGSVILEAEKSIYRARKSLFKKGSRSLLKWSPGGTLARETPTLGTPLELTAQKTRPHHGTYVWVPYRLTPRSERVHGRGRGNLRYEPEQGRHIGEQYFFCVSGWELDRSDKWSDVAQWDDDTTCTKHLTFEAAQKIADEHHLHHRGIRGIRGSRSKRFFQVNSPAQGLKVIKDKAITDNWKKSLRVRRKNPVAVLLPCAGTKPFPEAPSHKHGYLEALDGLDVDLYVVSEPLGVVPYAWSRTWPNDSYDFPPKHLKGEGRDLLVSRIGEWLDKVGTKYQTVISALPIHHRKLVTAANDGDLKIVDASMTACRNGSCSDRSFRATSDEYKKWLRRKVQSHR